MPTKVVEFSDCHSAAVKNYLLDMSPLRMEQKDAELYSGAFCNKVVVGQLPM